MTDSEMIDSLRVHRFEPGDRLVLKLSDPHASHEEAERYRVIAEKWSGVPVLVVGVGIELEVARGLPAMQPGLLNPWLLTPDQLKDAFPPDGVPPEKPVLAPNVEVSNTGYLRGLSPEGEPRP